jgi:hypothetical protein
MQREGGGRKDVVMEREGGGRTGEREKRQREKEHAPHHTFILCFSDVYILVRNTWRQKQRGVRSVSRRTLTTTLHNLKKGNNAPSFLVKKHI